MIKRYILTLALSVCGLLLVSCSAGEATSQPVSDVSSEESLPEEESVESSASSEEFPEENGEHAVTLCNGFDQDITELRIRSSADDYWSVEILQGTVWQSGTAISLTLLDTEWTFAPDWQAEVLLADGSTRSWNDLPLSDEDILELKEDAAAESGE